MGTRSLKFHWLSVLLFTLAINTGLYFYSVPTTPQSASITLTEADFSVSTAQNSSATKPFKSVTLPHDWKVDQLAQTEGRYSLRFTAATEDNPNHSLPKNRAWGLYIPHLAQSVSVQLNGHFLSNPSDSAVSPYFWNRPLLIPFDHQLLRADNQLIIELHGQQIPYDNYLSRMYIAPISTLQPVWSNYHWFRVDSLELMNSVLLFIGGFMLVLWWFMQRQSVYAWSALAALSLVLYNLNFIVTDLPLPYPRWLLLIFAACAWTVLFFILASSRFSGFTRPRFEWGIFLFSLLGLIPLLFSDLGELHQYGFSIWVLTLILIGIVAYLQMYRFGIRNARTKEPFYVLFCATLMISFGVHDFLLLNAVIDRSRPLLFSYGLFSLILAHSGFVLMRFIRAMRETQRMNQIMEIKLKEQAEALQTNYQKLLTLEKDQLLAQERERIMEDMHDGVGGQLVATLAMLDGNLPQQQIRDQVEEGLTDLRLVINSFDDSATDLASLLGTFRHQITPSLQSKNIRLLWQPAMQLEFPPLLPSQSLNILRILQELVTNTLKHSGATELTFETYNADDASTDTSPLQGVYIRLTDNGHGFSNTTSGLGRGLGNMQKRAAMLGGKIDQTSSPQGCRATLFIPFPQH